MKCIVGKEVKSFRVGNVRYKPGDVVELPDDYPIEKYPFLQKIAERGAPVAASQGVPAAAPVAAPVRVARKPRPKRAAPPQSPA